MRFVVKDAQRIRWESGHGKDGRISDWVHQSSLCPTRRNSQLQLTSRLSHESGFSAHNHRINGMPHYPRQAGQMQPASQGSSTSEEYALNNYQFRGMRSGSYEVVFIASLWLLEAAFVASAVRKY